jgi:fibronectin-binding autotransporter adhesin
VIGNSSGAPGSLTILDSAGGGSVILSAANTYTGATIVGDGVNSVTLALSGAGSIANSTSLTINNNATFDISAATPTSVTTADGQTSVTAVAIKNLQDGAGANGSSAINLGGNTLYVNQQSAGTFSGVIQDGGNGGALFKDGAGTLTLAGVNTYTGGTSIYAGTLALSGSGSISQSSSLTIYNGGTFDISSASPGQLTTFSGAQLVAVEVNDLKDGTNTTKNGSAINLGSNTLYIYQPTSGTFSGQIVGGSAGNLALFKGGAGTLTLAGNSNYSGLTAIAGGTLAGGTTNAFSANSGIIVAQGGTLDLGGYNQTSARCLTPPDLASAPAR